MRNKIVTVADKNIDVKEKRIGELETLVAEIFPGSKGKIADIGNALNDIELDWDLAYKFFPKLFPELTKDDIKNAYMSELEALMEAFVNVNFLGIKNLIKQVTRLIPIGSTQK